MRQAPELLERTHTHEHESTRHVPSVQADHEAADGRVSEGVVVSASIFKATIPGRCIVKKNTARRVGRGRSTRMIYSPKFVSWHTRAMVSLLEAFKANSNDMIVVSVEAHFKFYFANRQAEADVSNLIEGPQDALVKAGVLKDDRLIQRVVAAKYFGGVPRVEIELFRVEAA